MDQEARQRLIRKGVALYEDGNTLPVVTMEEFFTGNTDDWSVGRHMQTSREIPVREYATVFRTIRARPEVQEVFVELCELPDESDPEEREMWPSAFIFFVVTSAPVASVEEWIKQLEPRYLDEGWCVDQGVKVPLTGEQLLPGMRPVRVELL